MKKILFPTDFSEAAENAYIYALNLAKHLGASITTLHVYTRPELQGMNLPKTLQTVYEAIELDKFENYRDEIPYLRQIAADNQLDQIPVDHLMIEGDTVETIVETAAAEKTNLIVMGTQGATGLREVFWGSITTKVINQIKTCPILAIPDIAIFDGKIDNIAITTEYDPSEQEALRYLLWFAKHFNANVHCLHVDTSHTEIFTDRMNGFIDVFRQDPHLHTHILEGYDLERSIGKWLSENNMDLVTMVTRSRSAWRRFFEIQYTKQFVNHLCTPVLAIPVQVLEYQILKDFQL